MAENTAKTPAAAKKVEAPKAKKAPAAKAATNGKAESNGKTAAKTNKPSKRLRLFKLLAQYPEGLDNAQIRKRLKTDSIAAMCRDETVAGRLKVLIPDEGKRGKRFAISAAGKKALEKGKVDSEAAPKAEWPE